MNILFCTYHSFYFFYYSKVNPLFYFILKQKLKNTKTTILPHHDSFISLDYIIAYKFDMHNVSLKLYKMANDGKWHY